MGIFLFFLVSEGATVAGHISVSDEKLQFLAWSAPRRLNLIFGGGFMRRLYKYLVTLSLCLPASCGKNGSDGATGAAGDPGFSGSDGQKGGSSLVTVYDKGDKKVGWLLSNSNTAAFLPVLLTNGFLVTIEFSTGLMLLDRGHERRFINVYYSNINCAARIGTTDLWRVNESDYRPGLLYEYSPQGDSPVTGDGVDLGTFAYQSVSYIGSGSNAGKVICSPSNGTLPNSYATRKWFPLEPPLSLRAE